VFFSFLFFFFFFSILDWISEDSGTGLKEKKSEGLQAYEFLISKTSFTMKGSENPPTTPATKGASNGITTSASANGDVTTAPPTTSSTTTTNGNNGNNASSNVDGNAAVSSNNSAIVNGTKAKPATLSVNTSAANGDGAVAAATANGTKGRRDRPCDACRRRKSRCVMNEGAEICVLCNFHSQECTFVQSPQPRKRRLASSNVSSEDQVVIKKRYAPFICSASYFFYSTTFCKGP